MILDQFTTKNPDDTSGLTTKDPIIEKKPLNTSSPKDWNIKKYVRVTGKGGQLLDKPNGNTVVTVAAREILGIVDEKDDWYKTTGDLWINRFNTEGI